MGYILSITFICLAMFLVLYVTNQLWKRLEKLEKKFKMQRNYLRGLREYLNDVETATLNFMNRSDERMRKLEEVHIDDGK